MPLIRVGGADPSLTHTGLAKLDYDLASGTLSLVEIDMIVTKPEVTKQTRRNSDDLRRVQAIVTRTRDFFADCDVVFGEIPTGAQSARAAYAFGMVLGIFGWLSVSTSLVQVQPSETKIAATGSKNGSKDEIIAWAVALYPDAPWLRYDRKIKTRKIGDIHDDNEHMADAVAVVYAGVRLEEFRRSVTMWKRAA